MMTQKTIATFQTERDIGMNLIGVDKVIAVEDWEGTGDRLFLVKNLYGIDHFTTIKEAYLNGNFTEVLLDTTALNNPTGGVTSVNGESGDVTIDSSNIGLDNVDNTADLDKPISTLTQDALDLKVNTSDIIDNVISTDIDKPLSANQGLVLDTKIDTKDNKKVDILDISGNITLSDVNLNVFNNCSALSTITVPVNVFDIGDDFVFFRDTDAEVSIVADVGVTIKSKNNFLKIKSKYSSVVLLKTGVNEFSLIGDLA